MTGRHGEGETRRITCRRVSPSPCLPLFFPAWRFQQKGCASCEAHPGDSLQIKPALELETRGQLHLAFAEQCAISARRGTEWSVSNETLSEARRTAGGSVVVDRAVDTGDLSSIEQVESFGKNFQLSAFCD